jgi:translation initiation factor 4E
METENKQNTINNLNDEYSGIQLQNPKNDVKIALLNSKWVFWYASRKEQDHHIIYDERLLKLAEFNDLQSFFHYYSYMKPVWDIDRNVDISLFKSGYKPCWESCQDGGCWFIRFKKADDIVQIDTIWENMLFSLISEQFDEANVLGAVLSIRGRETIIELWFNYFKYDQIKSGLLRKMETILGIPKNTVIYFKDNQKALTDNSTLRNAETYTKK